MRRRPLAMSIRTSLPSKRHNQQGLGACFSSPSLAEPAEKGSLHNRGWQIWERDQFQGRGRPARGQDGSQGIRGLSEGKRHDLPWEAGRPRTGNCWGNCKPVFASFAHPEMLSNKRVCRRGCRTPLASCCPCGKENSALSLKCSLPHPFLLVPESGALPPAGCQSAQRGPLAWATRLRQDLVGKGGGYGGPSAIPGNSWLRICGGDWR